MSATCCFSLLGVAPASFARYQLQKEISDLGDQRSHGAPHSVLSKACMEVLDLRQAVLEVVDIVAHTRCGATLEGLQKLSCACFVCQTYFQLAKAEGVCCGSCHVHDFVVPPKSLPSGNIYSISLGLSSSILE